MSSSVQHFCRVISNKKLCPQFYHLQLEASSIVKKARPGQFVNIRIQDNLEPFFRRPFSIYRSQKYIEVFYEPVGKGTQILASKKKGEILDVLGPLGNTFTLPSKKIKQVVMVAGGIGVAPFLALSDVLKKRNIEMILLYGGRTKAHVYLMKEFKQNGVKIYIATDDGSVGVKGRVSNLFSKINLDTETTYIYTCGPTPMMKAVQSFAKDHGLKGEAACEETMACGVGVCLGCAIKTQSGYKTVCYEGPVFDLQEVIF